MPGTAATLDCMAIQHGGFHQSEHVVKCQRLPSHNMTRSSRIVRFCLAGILLIFLAAFPVVQMLGVPILPVHEAIADEAGTKTPSGGTITDQITDTQNLLGSDAGSVTDAIASTKEETGVSVRLLYLPSFYQGMEPDAWAKQVLQSIKPVPNTVLLAVASQDGKLVVAVSSNSEDWLKDQKTVDRLSQAALDPISKGNSPDWVGSAKAMMNEISQIHTNRQHQRLLIYLGSGLGLVLLVLILVWVVWRYKGRKRKTRHDRH